MDNGAHGHVAVTRRATGRRGNVSPPRRADGYTEPYALAAGIWLWRAPHPEWHPTTERVAWYALETGGGLALVDPLLPVGGEGALLDWLSARRGAAAAAVFVTIPYHVRSAEAVAGALDAPVVGHPALAHRLADPGRLVDATAAGELPLGIVALRIGNPRRHELPLLAPDLRALAFGDAVVGVEGGLRVWDELGTASRRRWYEHRFLPTLAPLAELDVEHVLVTHGRPVVGAGRAALRDLLTRPPVRFGAAMLEGDAAARGSSRRS